jgi:hypothetical protein
MNDPPVVQTISICFHLMPQGEQISTPGTSKMFDETGRDVDIDFHFC